MKNLDLQTGLGQKKMVKLLETVVAERTLLTVVLPGSRTSYRTRLLNFQNETDAAALVIAPLEPSDGNLKIRRTLDDPTIQLSFVSNNQSYQGEVSFLGLALINNSQVLQLSLPHQLKPTEKIRRRGEKRVIIPGHINLVATLSIEGQEALSGCVEDLSSGGLTFSCSPLSSPLCEGELVKLVLQGKVIKGETIPTSGIIRRHLVLRKTDEPHECADHYGLQFRHLSPASAMALDRLVRLRIPAPEEAWFMTEQVRFSSTK
ncbi:MAG: PilZ domain-containing protein [Magnetococcales bacterium]|nr:PilZ domain-containing protein [Magnetococcales bacterium]